MRRFILLTLLFCIIASAADAQVKRKKRRSGFTRKKPPYRYELIGSLGGANILGDLGGADQIGTNGFKDLELILTRPALAVSIRVKPSQLGPFLSIKNNFYWGILRGDDKLTNEPFRHNRNLHFRSHIVELSSQLEFNFIKEQKGHIYRIKGVRGMRHKYRQFYFFAGGGGFYFNPQAKYPDNGKWYFLRPIGTEGQGRIPGKNKYSLIQPMIMFGGGMRFAINRYWGAGFELGMRKTFTDYIDDASGTYPDPEIFNGDTIAEYFSNPSGTNMAPGLDLRGDKSDKDAYMFATFTVGYKFLYRKRARSKF